MNTAKIQRITRPLRTAAETILDRKTIFKFAAALCAAICAVTLLRQAKTSDSADTYATPIFGDITADNFSDIDAVYQDGIMFPSGKGNFGVGEDVSASEAAYIAVRLYEMKNDLPRSFPEYSPENGEYAEKADEYGVMPDFADEYLTREDTAALLAQFTDDTAPDLNNVTEISGDYPDSVIVMCNKGIMLEANIAKAFSPSVRVTRGEIARLIRMLTDPNARLSGIGPDLDALTDMLNAQIGGYDDGDWSVYYEDVNTGGKVVINNRRAYSASLIKLYVAMAVYTEIAEGKLTDSDTIEDEVARMITYSDNDSWKALARTLGGGDYMSGMAAVTSTAQAEGFTDSGQFIEGGKLNYNFTSVSDCGRYLHRLLNGAIVSPEYSKRILDLIRAQEILHKIPAGVPNGVETANKTGELEYMQGDAAIIYAPFGTYILTVIADNITNEDTAQTRIREISEAVYGFLNENLHS